MSTDIIVFVPGPFRFRGELARKREDRHGFSALDRSMAIFSAVQLGQLTSRSTIINAHWREPTRLRRQSLHRFTHPEGAVE